MKLSLFILFCRISAVSDCLFKSHNTVESEWKALWWYFLNDIKGEKDILYSHMLELHGEAYAIEFDRAYHIMKPDFENIFKEVLS